MTTRPRKSAAKKTTLRAPAKETVAEEQPREREGETVAAPPSTAAEHVALVPPPVAPTTQQPDAVGGLGPCVTCGAPGAVKVELSYTVDKPVFCRKDTPPMYRRFLQ